MPGQRTMKKKAKVTAFLLSVMAANASIAADNIQLSGVWKEKEGTAGTTAIYSFLRDYEFEYRFTYSDGTQVYKGVWHTGANLCGVREEGANGNLMIHFG